MGGRTSLTLDATKDVDVKANYSHAVKEQFEKLLTTKGYFLDPLGHEVWMPRETRYHELYRGKFVRLVVAQAEQFA